jgi:hypothetical protein
MDPMILQKIKNEIAQHDAQQLAQINQFCVKLRGQQKHISLLALGKQVAQRFGLEVQAGIKLANGWNRYMF